MDIIYMSILNNEVALDEVCWCCEGGTVDSSKPEYTNIKPFFEDGACTICKGVGHRLTDAGQAVIDLVKRHYMLCNR